MADSIHWFLKPLAESAFGERWPYGPGSTFHPDLGIELGASFRASNPVLAVVSGSLSVIPISAGRCGLFLVPNDRLGRALANGIGDLAFYLRTVDLDDLVERLKARITAKHPRHTTEAKQIENFRKGLVRVTVKTGEELAVLAPEAGTQSGLAQFEVIFSLQRGSRVGAQFWLDHARRLVDPANRFRRMDPMSFYYAVLRGKARDVKIHSDHTSHPLWVKPTIRGLIELREERDQPFPTSVHFVAPTTEDVTLRDEDWAHRQVVAPGNADGTEIAVVLHKLPYTLSLLPSEDEPGVSRDIREKLPFHVALQSIYLAKAEDADSWFRKPTAPMEFFTERNKIEPLIDGPSLFLRQKMAIERLNGADQFIWHAGWYCNDDFALAYELKDGRPDFNKPVANTKLLDLLSQVATAGGQVRLIAWQQNKYVRLRGLANSKTVGHVNQLPNHKRKGALLDGQTMFFGSHHQKFTIVYRGPDDAVAFCGGIDVNPNRLDTDKHAVAEPYHDVHAQLRGPVVHEFMKLYLERWNRHYLVKLHVVPDLPPPPQVNAVSDGSCFVQVTRTMPADAVILTGIQDSVEAVKCAVGRARRYIYIEDQYLWPYWGHGDVPYDSSLDPSGMVQALSDALDRPGFEYLLILIPGHVSVGQGRYRRREFLDTLKRKVKPENASKIHVYYLRTRAAKSAAIAAKAVLIDEDEADVIIADAKLPDDLPEEVKQSIVDMQPSGGDHHAGEIYVHTKVWIVDDVYVKCGSMNCNVRGFTYDSEADFHAVDGAVTRGKRRLALDLRKSLWAEHGRAEREDVPDDIVDALAWWQGRVTPTSRLAPYDTSGDKLKLPPQIPLAAFDFDWRTILDPDGSGTIV